MLYQRYFLRMNQTNMTHLLGLLLATSVVLMVVQLRSLVVAINADPDRDESIHKLDLYR